MCWIENIKSLNLQITDRDIEVYKIVLDANKQSCKSIIMGFDYTVNTPYYIPTIEYEVFDHYYKKIKIKKHTIVILGYVLYWTLLIIFMLEQLNVKILYLESDECVFLLKMRLI